MFLRCETWRATAALAELALTGDGRKRAVSTTRTSTPSAPRKVHQFLEERKDDSKKCGLIAPIQGGYLSTTATAMRM